MARSLRIVSLVPSLTKSVCDLGLRSELVGCTQFCMDPPGLHRSAHVTGGTKNPDIPAILSLKPTHILYHREENLRAHYEQLSSQCKAEAFVDDTCSVAGAVQLVRRLGESFECRPQAETYVEQMTEKLEQLRQGSREDGVKKRAFYLIWRRPYMAAGPGTYIADLVKLMGYELMSPLPNQPYPTLDMQTLQRAEPHRLFLSSEPYPFRNRHAQALLDEWRAYPGLKPGLKAGLKTAEPRLHPIDGKLCSWFGTLTLEALQYAAKLRCELDGEDGSKETPLDRL